MRVTQAGAPSRSWLAGRFKLGQGLRRLWQPLQLASILVGFLLGRMFPSTGLAPVGLAFFGAARGAGFSPLATGLIGLAVLGGATTTLAAQNLAGLSALVMGLFIAYAVSSRLKVESGKTSPMVAVLLGAFPVAAASAALVSIRGLTGGSLVPLLLSGLLWAGITGCLALLFNFALVEIQTGQWLRATEAEQPMANLILMAALMTSLHAFLPAGWPSLRDMAALLVVLLAAYGGGAALGALYGGVFAMMIVLFPAQDVPVPWQVAATMRDALNAGLVHGMGYVAAGILAGTFRAWYGRIGAGLAGLGGMLLMLLSLGAEYTTLRATLVGGLISALLFWLLPPSWVKRIGRGLSRQNDGASEVAEPTGLTDRLEGLARVLRQVGQSAQEMAAVVEPLHAEPIERAGGAIRTLQEQLCEGCGLREECWRQFPERTGLILTELWGELEAGRRLPLSPLPAHLTDICIYPEQVVSLLNLTWEQGITHRQLVQHVSEHRHLAANWLSEVSALLEGVLESGKLPGARTKKPAAFRLTVSAAARPQRAGAISGDIYLSEPLSDDRHLLLLSDGMGVGADAAQISQTAVTLLRDLLASGMDLGPAVKTLNALLLLQAKEERFTTLDAALVDLTDGRCRFVKSGAAPTFIKRGEMVSVVRGESVPVGILPDAPVEPVGRVLRGGDLLVLLTDGLWEAVATQDGPDWVEAFLRAVPASEPNELAEALLARVDEGVDEPRDDRSLLVVRVEALPGHRRTAAARRPKRTKAKAPVADAEQKETSAPAEVASTAPAPPPERPRLVRAKPSAKAPEPMIDEPQPGSAGVAETGVPAEGDEETWAPVRVARTRAVRRNPKEG